ncbi:MAG: hypothetical protein M1358_24595 [Chloroflexi bacterium]|nr:hypothetical protein [Chloroflexota bacterium]
MKKRIVAALFVLGLLVFTSSQALAAELRNGNNVTVGPEEVINDDLYVTGGTVNVAGTVNGDLFVGGGSVMVTGVISGSVSAAGGQVRIAGPVGGSIRAAGGNVTIESRVAKDVVIAGGILDISAGSTIGRDLILAGGTAHVAGAVEGRLRGSLGQLTISGAVGKDVDVQVNNLTLEPSARIGGNLHYESENQADIRPGATIGGVTARTEPPERRVPSLAERVWLLFVSGLKGLVSPLILGALLLLLFPRTATGVARTIGQSPLRTFGWGLLTFIAAPLLGLAVLIAGFLLGGAAIGLVIFGIYAILLVFASVFVGLFIGERVLGLWRRDLGGFFYWALLLGLVILAILSAVPILNIVVAIVTILFGIGAVVLAAIRRYRTARAEGTI